MADFIKKIANPRNTPLEIRRQCTLKTIMADNAGDVFASW